MFENEIFYECSICGLVYFDYYRASDCCSCFKHTSSESSYSEGESESND